LKKMEKRMVPPASICFGQRAVIVKRPLPVTIFFME